MLNTRAALLLLSALVGLLLGVVTWGFWRLRRHWNDEVLMEQRDDILIGLLVLAAFTLGVFVTYFLLNFYR